MRERVDRIAVRKFVRLVRTDHFTLIITNRLNEMINHVERALHSQRVQYGYKCLK